jgi:DNA-binding NtrC family response regulator
MNRFLREQQECCDFTSNVLDIITLSLQRWCNASMNAAILVVDDEQNLVSLLEMVLTKRGYQVHAALTVEEAQNLIDRTAFDLALIDIKIGPKDGLSLLEEIKKRRPDTKAIMITAYPTRDTQMRSLQRGASAYFTKPLDLTALLETIHGLV